MDKRENIFTLINVMDSKELCNGNHNFKNLSLSYYNLCRCILFYNLILFSQIAWVWIVQETCFGKSFISCKCFLK